MAAREHRPLRATRDRRGLPGSSTAPSAASSRSPAPTPKEFLAGQVTNDIVGARRRASGCYAALLTPKGKMLGDLRVLRHRRRAAARHGARRAAGALRHRPPRDDRLPTSSCTSARCSAALLSLVGPARARGRRRGRTCPRPSTRIARRRSAALRCASSRPTSASTCSALADDTDAVRDALVAAGAEPVSEEAAEVVRVERGPAALRRRARRHDDPAGGRAQRARRQLHEGLLRRAGDRRPPVLEGQAEPPPARPAAAARPPIRHAAAPRRPRGRPARRASSLSPAHGPIALALVRREAGVGDVLRVGDGDVTATVVELPVRAAPCGLTA